MKNCTPQIDGAAVVVHAMLAPVASPFAADAGTAGRTNGVKRSSGAGRVGAKQRIRRTSVD